LSENQTIGFNLFGNTIFASMKKPATKRQKPSKQDEATGHSPYIGSSQSTKDNKTPAEISSKIISPLKVITRDFVGTNIENIIHLSHDIIISLAKDHNIQTINKAGCKALGYPQNKLIGENWFERFVTPSMKTSALKSLQKLFSGEEDSMGYIVIPIINKKEEEYLIEWECLALKDTEGSTKGILLSGRDITQQKMIEKELIQSEWDMALAQKIARLGSWVFNVSTHEVRMSNETHQIFETSPKMFQGTYKAFLKLIHPDDRHRVDASHQESFRTGKGHQVEYRILLPDDTERIIYEESRVFLDDLDNPLKVRGIVQDITERKKVEEALRHSERELSIAQKIGKMGNWVYDIDIEELWWSDEVYRIFGHRPKEFNASYQAFLNAVHPEDREFVDSTNKKIMENKKNYSMDHRIVLPDGTFRTVHQECKTFYNEQGKPTKLRGIVQDITERKQAEEKLKTYQEQLSHAEKLSSIGRLSGSIAHEINNPLFGIRNVLERTKMCVPLKEADEHFIDMAISETDRIAKLTRRLNNFFSPTREKKEAVQINQVLEEMALLSQKELTDRNIQLTTHYSGVLPEISAYPDQIKQVALNLFQNAMDAIPETGGEISLSTHHQDSHLYFTIKDNGVGMSRKTRKDIFEPFFTTKSKAEGTGLGLWVTHGIVQSHGGLIEVSSQSGKGTSFTVSLPMS
jgi:two-component system sporulation sensor kinase A